MPGTNFCRSEGVPEDLRLEEGAPNDADDAGPLGQHHQHHWGSVSPIWRYQAAAMLFLVCFMMAFAWHQEGSS